MDDGKLIELTGKIVYVVYRNDATMYTVMKFRLQDETEKVITCTGILPSVETDILTRLYGTYVEHPKYGMQFAIQSMERPLPDEEEGIIRYLSGIQFPGIGKKTAKAIVNALGEDCLKEIRENPEILHQVPGLSDEKIQVITEGLQKESDRMQDLVRFLNIHGLGQRNLIRLNRAYGKDALEKIRENPYRVIEECDGFGFKTADKIADSLGIARDDERRLYAYLISLCMDLCVSSGDSYVLKETLQANFDKAMNGLSYEFEDLLSRAVFRNQLVLEENRVYPISQYQSESFISSFLASFPEEELEPALEESVNGYLGDLENRFQITYDNSQREAVHTFFQNPFLILTGGPGTGKTTVVRALVTLFRVIYPGSTVVCTAPTGRAAKHLAETTETEAVTIHSLLKWDLETNTFGVNEEEPLSADLLIIDEFSMVDNWLFYNLLKASRHIRKICVIGDEDQLPSVSPGSVLRDLIESGCFPLIRLSHIYRQKEGSDVIRLAHEIHDGTADFSDLNHDVKFLECSRYEIKDRVLAVVKSALDKGYDMNDIQVLSPIYGGPAGIDVLNNALQQCFNPPEASKPELKVGYLTFRLHDKILQLKNQPDDGISNGDIGELVEIYDRTETENHEPALVVRFEDDNYVEYNPEGFRNITLAYCISIHKAQGSEYPIVIMPMTYQYYYMLQRKLIYTGVTRARQSLVLLGEKGAFLQGISTLERHVRNTGLKEKLIQAQHQSI